MRSQAEAGYGADLPSFNRSPVVPRRSSHETGALASGLPREQRPVERSARVWPAAVAFLAPIVPPGALTRALDMARAQGVTPDRVLLAEGMVSEEAFYRTLARSCGAGFAPDDIAPTAGRHYPQAIRAGAVAVETPRGRRLLVAPQGEALARFVRLPSRALVDSVIVTTPTHLAESVRGAARAHELAQASDALRARDAALSARTPLPQRFVIALQSLCVALVFAIAVAPQAVWLMLSLAVSSVFLAGIALRGLAGFASCRPEPEAPPLADADLPVYSIVVALHREANVAAKLAAALDAMDYPRAKLDILLALEEGDAATIAAFRALDLPARYRIILAPEGQPRTKPRALNVALPLARGALLTIYDAEDEPEPGQLRAAAARFAASPPEVACLQGRLAIDNFADGWLARLFALEYAALFDVLNPGLAALGLPIALGGTSNHFRTAALREVGGWDAWNVTEDADLGLRLARCGYGVEALASATHEEAPARLSAWLGQRRRWLKGWMQTLAVHFRDPGRFVAELGVRRALAAFALMAGVVLGPLVGPIFLATTLWDVACGRFVVDTPAQAALAGLWGLVLSGGVISTLVMLGLGMKRRKLVGLWPWLALFPAYYALISWVAWRALFEWIDNPFHWEKTRHGLARTSRRAALRHG